MLIFWCLVISVLYFVNCDIIDNADALFQRGEYLKAYQLLEDSLPTIDVQDLAYAYSVMGNCLNEIGDSVKAATAFALAAKSSKRPEVYYNAGVAFLGINKKEEALDMFIACIRINNNIVPCHVKLAYLYQIADNFEKVQEHLQISIKLQPRNPELYRYLGDAYNNRKFFSEAVKMYQEAFEIHPSPTVLIALGNSLLNSKQADKALASFDKALAMIPQGTMLHQELSSGKPRDIKKISDVAIFLEALLGQFFTAQELAMWQNYELKSQQLISISKTFMAVKTKVQPKTDSEKAVFARMACPIPPYRLLFLDEGNKPYALSIVRNVTISCSDLVAPPQQSAALSTPFLLSRTPLRVAHISRRITNYPGTQMMLRLFGSYNRSRAEIFVISNGPDYGLLATKGHNNISRYRQIIIDSVNTFVDIAQMSRESAIASINEIQPHIIVDYDGMHDFNSLKFLSEYRSQVSKPLVVMTWLGFAGSVGQGNRKRSELKLAAIDYLIGDRVVLPPDVVAPHFTESLVYLPVTYQPQDEYSNDITLRETKLSHDFLSAPKTALRSHLLAAYNVSSTKRRESIVGQQWFISLNRLEKLTPDCFEDWMQMLKEAPASILILQSTSEQGMEHLIQYVKYFGIATNRVLFFPRLLRSDYSALLAVSDLYLDTRFYGAHTIASDAMYRMTPVLTLEGRMFANRVVTSLNNAVDLSESGSKYRALLSVHDRKQFVITGVWLLRCKSCLLKLRQTLANAHGKTLFNSVSFSNHLLRAYESIVDVYPKRPHVFFPNN